MRVELNQKENEQDEVDGMKKGANSTGKMISWISKPSMGDAYTKIAVGGL